MSKKAVESTTYFQDGVTPEQFAKFIAPITPDEVEFLSGDWDDKKRTFFVYIKKETLFQRLREFVGAGNYEIGELNKIDIESTYEKEVVCKTDKGVKLKKIGGTITVAIKYRYSDTKVEWVKISGEAEIPNVSPIKGLSALALKAAFMRIGLGSGLSNFPKVTLEASGKFGDHIPEWGMNCLMDVYTKYYNGELMKKSYFFSEDQIKRQNRNTIVNSDDAQF